MTEEKYVERVLTSVEDGSFLINRLGAAGVVDQDLAIVLLALRQRLTQDYGSGPAALMLIDRAVVAYQDFIRVEGWVGNLAIHIEHQFFVATDRARTSVIATAEGEAAFVAFQSRGISPVCARACSR